MNYWGFSILSKSAISIAAITFLCGIAYVQLQPPSKKETLSITSTPQFVNKETTLLTTINTENTDTQPLQHSRIIPTEANSLSAGLHLRGIYNIKNKLYAMISVDQKGDLKFYLHSEIKDGVTLDSIEKNSVVLRKGSQQERIFFSSGSSYAQQEQHRHSEIYESDRLQVQTPYKNLNAQADILDLMSHKNTQYPNRPYANNDNDTKNKANMINVAASSGPNIDRNKEKPVKTVNNTSNNNANTLSTVQNEISSDGFISDSERPDFMRVSSNTTQTETLPGFMKEGFIEVDLEEIPEFMQL